MPLVLLLSTYRAMENTLALMNSKNEGYRKSLTKVDKSSMPFAKISYQSTNNTMVVLF